jgi:hypothetical protein
MTQYFYAVQFADTSMKTITRARSFSSAGLCEKWVDMAAGAGHDIQRDAVSIKRLVTLLRNTPTRDFDACVEQLTADGHDCW